MDLCQLDLNLDIHDGPVDQSMWDLLQSMWDLLINGDYGKDLQELYHATAGGPVESKAK